MQKSEIIALIVQNQHILHELLINQAPENWEKGPVGKWTSGQQVMHLIQSIKPLNKALGIPKLILKYKFGINNRENRDYSTVVKNYHDKLQKASGVISPYSKDMDFPLITEKQDLLNQLSKRTSVLCKKINKWKANDLDKYLLPHPLMGRMTIREILMWTAYHTEHHYKQLKKDY